MVTVNYDATVMVAAVVDGSIYTSNDGGSSWVTGNTNSLPWMTVTVSDDGKTIFGAAYGDSLYKSTDSGASFAVALDTIGEWNALATNADCSVVVATMSQGDIYTSTDSGSTWVSSENIDEWTDLQLTDDGKKTVATTLGTSPVYFAVYEKSSMPTEAPTPAPSKITKTQSPTEENARKKRSMRGLAVQKEHQKM